MPLIFAPSANQISSVTLSSPTGYYGSTATFIVSTQGYNNGDTIYYSTTGSGIVQSTGTITVSNYLGDLGTTNIPITTIRTTSTTAVITATFYNGSTPVTLSSGVNSASIPLATPDQFFTATVLLLSPAGPGPTALTDLSGTTSTIQVVGSPNVRSFIPFTTPGVSSSMLFNGSLDQVIIPANTNNAFGTGDFTIEFWMYTVAFTSPSARVLSQGTHAAGEHLLLIYANGSFDWCGQVTPILAGSSLTGTFVQNTWQHVAITRIGTSMAFYVNGVSKTTATSSYNFSGVTQVCIGGNTTTAGQYFNGYISNLRITKGLGIYTGAFTPPSSPLQLTQSAGTNIAAITSGQTSLLLLQSPQSLNNASFLDSASTNTVITTGGTPAQGTFSPFWPYATTFNGTTQYLKLHPASTAYAFGTGDFTVEAWIYLTAPPAAGQRVVGGTSVTANGFAFGVTNASSNIYMTSNSVGYTSSAASISTSTWNHLAWTRQSGTVRMFINGVLDYSPGVVSTDITDLSGGIGAYPGGTGLFPGYISNLRVIKGQALYTGTFTPPSISSLLPATANTVLLTCQGPTSSDYSTFTNTVTSVGSVVTRPISTTTFLNSVYSTSTIGGSMYFDGTTVVSTTSTSGLHTLGGNDFTAECWFYTSTVSGSGQIMGFRTPTLSYAPFILWNQSGSITLYSSGTGGSWNIVNNTAVGTTIFNQWNHLAIVRTVNTMTVYLNGTSTFSVSVSGVTFAQVGWPLQIGASGVSSDPYTGFISNVRFVNGYAIYPFGTSRFAPSLRPLTASLTGTSMVVAGNNSGIYDATGFNNIATVNSATNSSSVVKFGSNSMFFVGNSYLNVISSTSTNFAIGTGDFTAEMWIYPTNVTGSFNLMAIGTEAAGRYVIYIVNGALTTNLYSSGVITMGGSIGTNAWTHIAVARQGSTIRGFINGVLLGTTDTNSGVIGNSNIAKVGSDASGAATFQGYISDVRLTKGVARYTATFTSATTYLPLV